MAPRAHGEAGRLVAGVRRIAVLRANALGDYLVTLPALDALRAAYPDAQLVLLGRPWHADFLRGRPGAVDEVAVLPPVPGLSCAAGETVDERAVEAFCADLRARRFDLALQLHGGGRYSNPLLLRLGARLTAGFAAPGSAPLDRVLAYQPLQSQLAHLLEAVGLVGADAISLQPRLALREQDRAQAEAMLPPTSRPLVLLQPGATDGRRRWPAARFAAVGDRCAARGALVAINGTGQEAPVVAAVAAAMHSPAVDLSGRLDAGGLAGLIARARLVVSNDTGPAHLARALGTPCVTVFWVPNLPTYGPLVWQNQRLAVAWRLDCPRCGLRCVDADCGHRDSFVEEVTVEQVMGLVEELWGDSRAA